MSAQPLFQVDDSTCSLAQLLDANACDEPLCEWAVQAAVGDRFPAFVLCVRVA